MIELKPLITSKIGVIKIMKNTFHRVIVETEQGVLCLSTLEMWWISYKTWWRFGWCRTAVQISEKPTALFSCGHVADNPASPENSQPGGPLRFGWKVKFLTNSIIIIMHCHNSMHLGCWFLALFVLAHELQILFVKLKVAWFWSSSIKFLNEIRPKYEIVGSNALYRRPMLLMQGWNIKLLAAALNWTNELFF